MATRRAELLERRKRGNKPASRRARRGATLALITLLMIPLVAMVAFSVDYGFLLKVDCDLQRCADHAALASLQDLPPGPDGTQDLALVRATVRNYVAANLHPGFQVLDSDIEIGRFDPNTIYSNVTLLNDGVFDAVRVTLRHDSIANSRVPLFFARALGMQDAAVRATATAVLQKPLALLPGAKILPFSVPEEVWDGHDEGDEWTIYGDGKIVDSSGAEVPGNWGTLDIGSTDNSTNDLNDQITNGLRQSDIDSLYADGRITTTTHIDTSHTVAMQGDTGISIGLKHSVVPIHGETRIIPIFDFHSAAPGNNLEYNVIRWGVVTVVDSNWQGATNTNVIIEKAYDYFGHLRPAGLGDTTGTIEGAFTSPVLVE